MLLYIRQAIVILLIFNYFFTLNTCDKAGDKVEGILMKIEDAQQKADDTLWFGLSIFQQMTWLTANMKSIDINIVEAIIRRIEIMERTHYPFDMRSKLSDIKVRAKGVLQSLEEEFSLEKESSNTGCEEECNEE